MAKTLGQEFTKGLWAEVPPYRLVLGLCPTLAMTTGVDNGLGMGLAVTFVLICSNMLISLLRKVIPKDVRIACFIIVIATFVIVVELMMQAYAYALFEQMGIFIPLIVVNCILLGRAEAFASKNGVVASCADGLGMGIGFTISLVILASIREVLGNGTFYKIPLFGPTFEPFAFMVTAPGAFVCLGLMLCVMNLLGKK
ncbi:MAG: electron transport complex subunit E [Deltaproteobacteria bacterium]|nr:electron transport complex subunit E [Deltaproteobacteria bacterium]